MKEIKNSTEERDFHKENFERVMYGKDESKDYQKTVNSNNIKLSPSKSRVLNMNYNVLIEHYCIIQLKKSKLPSAQRSFINNRVNFLLEKKKIDIMDIDKSLERLINLYNVK